MKYKYILLIVLLILVILTTLYYLYSQKYLPIEYFNNCNNNCNNNFNNYDNEFINNQNDNIYILDKSIIHKLINQNNIQN